MIPGALSEPQIGPSLQHIRHSPRRALAPTLVVVLLAGLVSALAVPTHAAAAPGDPVRSICFPVDGKVTYTDTWGAARAGGRTHQGTDIMGARMQPLLAAADATVSALQHAPAGNFIFLTDAQGWQYWYIHVNNDTPGTDDGANRFEHAFAPGMKVGSTVRAGQVIAYLGDSGNAESTSPHLHFELHQPDGSWGGMAVNPYESLRLAQRCGAIRESNRTWMVRAQASPGAPDRLLSTGAALDGDTVLACDWDGDGIDTPAVYSGGTWTLRDVAGRTTSTISYGAPWYRPVCGDWNGDGVDTIGVYTDTGWWLLRNQNGGGSPDIAYAYGYKAALPVVGDWDPADPGDETGVYDAGVWLLRDDVGPGQPQRSAAYGYRGADPVVGDWNGDGVDGFGVHDRGGWMLRETTTPGAPERWFSYGWSGPVPVTGRWTPGVDGIGVVSQG